jgi:molybdate transport system substrate-binding protein
VVSDEIVTFDRAAFTMTFHHSTVSSIRRQQLTAAFLLLTLSGCARREESSAPLRLAAAADLQFAMRDLGVAFQRDGGGPAPQVSYGSSGNFYSQIRNGAPFDLYLSADADYPRKLLGEGVGVQGSFFTYAIGRIAVWVPAASPLDPATALRGSGIRKLAIANPAHAPYGRAALAALQSMGVYDALQPRFVLGENISQAFEFVRSGAADAGIVALSLAMAPEARGQGRYWAIPMDEYPPIQQGGMIVKDSPRARAFRAFLTGVQAKGILRQYGFSAPEQH